MPIYDEHKTDVSCDLPGLEAKAFVGEGFWSLEVYVPLAGSEPTPMVSAGYAAAHARS